MARYQDLDLSQFSSYTRAAFAQIQLTLACWNSLFPLCFTRVRSQYVRQKTSCALLQICVHIRRPLYMSDLRISSYLTILRHLPMFENPFRSKNQFMSTGQFIFRRHRSFFFLLTNSNPKISYFHWSVHIQRLSDISLCLRTNSDLKISSYLQLSPYWQTSSYAQMSW